MSAGVGATVGQGIRAVFHPSSIGVAVLAAGFSYLAQRSHTDVGDVAFAAAITVLVFLLPAAGLVGPFLLSESRDALSIIARMKPGAEKNEGYNTVKKSLGTVIAAARPLQRGFSYTTLAVILSAFSLVKVDWTVHRVEVDQVLGATAIALLVGTAAMIFPMTWRLLQLAQAQTIYNVLAGNPPPDEPPAATTAGPAPAPGPGQPSGSAGADTRYSQGPGGSLW